MIPSTLNDPKNLFDIRLLTEAVASFTPEICWLTEPCDIASCDLNDERFTEKYGEAMKKTMSKVRRPKCIQGDNSKRTFGTF